MSNQNDFIALMASLRAGYQEKKVKKTTVVPDMVHLNKETVFNGKSVVFGGGKLKHFSRTQASDLVNELGGYIQSSITNSTNIIITPDKPEASSKIDKAKKKGVTIMPEKDFYAILKKNRAYLEENGYSVPK